MTPVARIFRTVIQYIISLAPSLATAATNVLTPVEAVAFGGGMVVVVAVLHNFAEIVGFVQKFIPAKYQHDVLDLESVLQRLESVASQVEAASKVHAGETHVAPQPMHAGAVPDVAGRDVLPKA